MRERIGALLQNPDLQIIAPKVWDDVSFSPRNYGYGKEKTDELVGDALKRLEIEHLKDKVPHYLSGGEKTKVALAGALVTKPELLILDEPFEHIDPMCRTEMIRLLNSVNRENGTAILLSTHNMNTVPLIADTVYLNGGRGENCREGNAERGLLDDRSTRRMPHRAAGTRGTFRRAEKARGRPRPFAHS